MRALLKGRGASFNPPNRFEQFHLEPIDIEWDDNDEDHVSHTTFFKDTSKSILAKNESPDIGFEYSINPYRGCEHGCIYCYARPSHEYLGFSAGLDFESKIMVKLDAPQLLEEAFKKKHWHPQMVCLSGNTDCYQPVERQLQITRHCLEVFLKYRNPVGIITKNALITRDIDILKHLAALKLVDVLISITSLDVNVIRKMEPRTSVPQNRLETIETLAANGIPVGVNVAPVIPGLNDEELPSILREAAQHGAKFAGMIMLRLPGAVRELFLDWLKREFPDRESKILNRIHDIRGGGLNDVRWKKRLSGEGELAKTIRDLFHVSCDRYGLNKERPEISTGHFQRNPEHQLEMFG